MPHLYLISSIATFMHVTCFRNAQKFFYNLHNINDGNNNINNNNPKERKKTMFTAHYLNCYCHIATSKQQSNTHTQIHLQQFNISSRFVGRNRRKFGGNLQFNCKIAVCFPPQYVVSSRCISPPFQLVALVCKYALVFHTKSNEEEEPNKPVILSKDPLNCLYMTVFSVFRVFDRFLIEFNAFLSTDSLLLMQQIHQV